MAAPEGARRLRVAGLVRRELAAALQSFARANDAGLLSLTRVDVAPDLRSALVGVSAIGGRLPREALLARLADAAGELRSHLARSLALRTVPRLRFEIDDSLEEAVRLSGLIREGLPADRGDAGQGQEALDDEDPSREAGAGPGREPSGPT